MTAFLSTRTASYPNSLLTQGTRKIMKCTHVKADGIRCGSPALRGEAFCYFHHHNAGYIARRASHKVEIPFPEDAASIQVGIYNIMRGVLDQRLDESRSRILLWALQIAAAQTDKLPFEDDYRLRYAVTELPHYEVDELETDDEPEQTATEEGSDAKAEQESVAEEGDIAPPDPDAADESVSAAVSGMPDLSVEQVNEIMKTMSSGGPGAANRLIRQLCP
jgi:hypothetical protein